MFSHFFIVPPKIVIETFIATIYFHRLGKLREDFLLRLRRSNLKIVHLSRHARVWSLFTKAIFSDDSTLCDGTSLTVSKNCFLAATAKKLKCSIKDSCSKNMFRKLQIWPLILKKSLMEYFMFCVVWSTFIIQIIFSNFIQT